MASTSLDLGNVGLVYEISVNNPGQEFSNFLFNIAPGGPGGQLTASAIDSAIQAFADSIVSSDPNFYLRSITKTETVVTDVTL